MDLVGSASGYRIRAAGEEDMLAPLNFGKARASWNGFHAENGHLQGDLTVETVFSLFFLALLWVLIDP
jgi:hypothetical protein